MINALRCVLAPFGAAPHSAFFAKRRTRARTQPTLKKPFAIRHFAFCTPLPLFHHPPGRLAPLPTATLDISLNIQGPLPFRPKITPLRVNARCCTSKVTPALWKPFGPIPVRGMALAAFQGGLEGSPDGSVPPHPPLPLEGGQGEAQTPPLLGDTPPPPPTPSPPLGGELGREGVEPEILDLDENSTLPPAFLPRKTGTGAKKLNNLRGDDYLLPDTARSRFLVARPNLVWCVDICHLKTVIQEPLPHNMLFFAIIDVADGRIVGWFCQQDIVSADVVNFLMPLIRQQEAIKNASEDMEEKALLIHSDRGSQFRSHLYVNMMVTFDPMLILSHSGSGSPTANSPIERLFLTLIRNKTFWSQVGFPDGEPATLKNDQLLLDYLTRIVNLYNTQHLNPRSLGLAPVEANFAFQIAKVSLLKPGQYLIANNQQPESVDFKEVLLFRQQVAYQNWKSTRKVPESLAEAQQQGMIRAMAYQQQKLEEQATQSLIILQQIQGLAASTAISKKKAKPRKNATRKIFRDPFTRSALDMFVKYAFSVRHATPAHFRNVLAVILLSAAGLRISDVSQLRHSNIRDFINHRLSIVYNVKQNKKQKKAVDSYAVRLLKKVYPVYLNIIEAGQGYTVQPNDYVFVKNVPTSEWGKDSALLNLKAFDDTMNRVLERFAFQFNAKKKANLTFKTHSGRIGFVTRLRQAGIDIGTVSGLVGHAQSSTTELYDRYGMTDAQRLAFLEQANVDGNLSGSEEEEEDTLS